MIVFLGYVILLTAGLIAVIQFTRRRIRTSSRGLFLIGFSWAYLSLVFYLAGVVFQK
jgi:hypothetical protein